MRYLGLGGTYHLQSLSMIPSSSFPLPLPSPRSRLIHSLGCSNGLQSSKPSALSPPYRRQWLTFRVQGITIREGIHGVHFAGGSGCPVNL